jgi:hypothetical protein
MARSFNGHHGPPPPGGISPSQQWVSYKLKAEFDVLSNLIYLAQREPDQRERYLKVAQEIVDRIRLSEQRNFSIWAVHERRAHLAEIINEGSGRRGAHVEPDHVKDTILLSRIRRTRE